MSIFLNENTEDKSGGRLVPSVLYQNEKHKFYLPTYYEDTPITEEYREAMAPHVFNLLEELDIIFSEPTVAINGGLARHLSREPKSLHRGEEKLSAKENDTYWTDAHVTRFNIKDFPERAGGGLLHLNENLFHGPAQGQPLRASRVTTHNRGKLFILNSHYHPGMYAFEENHAFSSVFERGAKRIGGEVYNNFYPRNIPNPYYQYKYYLTLEQGVSVIKATREFGEEKLSENNADPYEKNRLSRLLQLLRAEKTFLMIEALRKMPLLKTQPTFLDSMTYLVANTELTYEHLAAFYISDYYPESEKELQIYTGIPMSILYGLLLS